MNEHIEHLINNMHNFSEVVEAVESSDDERKIDILAYYITQAAFEDDYAINAETCHAPILAHYECMLTMLDYEEISVDTENFVRERRIEILDMAHSWALDLLKEESNDE